MHYTQRMKAFFLFALVLISGTSIAQTGEEWYKSGMEAYEKGRLTTALEAFDAAVKADGKKGIYYKMRGDTRLKVGEAKQAMSDYNKAEKLEYKEAGLYLSRGAAHLTMEDYTAALADLDKCIEMDPENANAWFNRGSAYYLNEEPAKAVNNYEKVLQIDPDFVDAWYFLGVAKSEVKGSSENGIAEINKALALDTSLADAYLSIAIIKFDRKEYDDAIHYLDIAIKKKNDHLAAAYFYRAESKFQINDKEGACEDWAESGELGDPEAQRTFMDLCLKGKEKKPTRRRGNREVITF